MKFLEDVVAKWEGFDAAEDGDQGSQKAKAFLAEGKLFEKSWRKSDKTKE